MKSLVKLCLMLALLASTQVFAQSGKPTQESLDRLFVLTDVAGMMPKMQAQIDTMMNNMVQTILAGKSVTPEQQKALDVFRAKITRIQADEFNWENLHPKISEVYANSFTQEEVDGLIAFYQTPVGASVVHKMPVVMQQSMSLMQTSMLPLIKKIEAASVELRLDLQRIETK